MTEYIGAAYTEEEKARIQLQLDRVLANVHFSNSKRFPSFLRFIVQEELEGRGDQLKERTLGIEVFSRDASYDTTSDPIVRVTAAEIRKRIAQYYQEPGHAGELRISLPPGSYVPHFDWPHADVASPPPLESSRLARAHSFPEPVALPVQLRPHLAAAFSRSAWRSSCSWPPLSSICAPAQRRSTSSGRPSSAPETRSSFASPQSHLSGIVLRDANDPGQQHPLQEGMNALIVDDLRPLVSLSGLLELRHQRYVLMGEDTATLTDLRNGPTIFVGAFDNAWTLRVTRNLRFRFNNDPEMKHFWIEDTQSATHTHWSIDRNQQEATNNYKDYAIVARFQDPDTGKPAIVAAGIARGGTVAAGEFLTQPANMEALKSQTPKNWDGKNMEFVLSTEIIDGKSAPPKIEAVYFW